MMAAARVGVGLQTICAARGETAAEHLQPLVAAGLCMPEEAKLLAGAPDPYMLVISPCKVWRILVLNHTPFDDLIDDRKINL